MQRRLQKSQTINQLLRLSDESQALLWTIVCVIGLGAAGTAVVFAGKERK